MDYYIKHFIISPPLIIYLFTMDVCQPVLSFECWLANKIQLRGFHFILLQWLPFLFIDYFLIVLLTIQYTKNIIEYLCVCLCVYAKLRWLQTFALIHYSVHVTRYVLCFLLCTSFFRSFSLDPFIDIYVVHKLVYVYVRYFPYVYVYIISIFSYLCEHNVANHFNYLTF